MRMTNSSLYSVRERKDERAEKREKRRREEKKRREERCGCGWYIKSIKSTNGRFINNTRLYGTVRYLPWNTIGKLSPGTAQVPLCGDSPPKSLRRGCTFYVTVLVRFRPCNGNIWANQRLCCSSSLHLLDCTLYYCYNHYNYYDHYKVLWTDPGTTGRWPMRWYSY